ncbi:hypothetical protein RHMOL_Rhmol06G0123300 [Rhododendron molle]|uniref:Uncharacterized protein n=1 Tax=Rhododendron molle TaxID=49168 RepID=A0ACC0NBM2_RHOML|nr:hypothetical protein RHMOL_Rhmol06G0123300 [Rhododendron molle]
MSSVSSIGSSSTGSATSKPVDHDENAPLWDYVTKLIKRGEGANNTKFNCNLCNLEFQGSYMRVKAHLLLTKDKGIRLCSVVKERSEFLVEIRKAHEEAGKRKIMAQPKNVSLPPPSTKIGGVGGFRLEGYDPEPKKRKAAGNSLLEKAMNMGARKTLHSHIARMFYSAGLPFHLARNPYFISAFQFAVENNIPGYVPPGYNLLRTTLHQKERAHIALLLEPIKKTWNEKGLSVVANGWSDAQRRPLINFMGASDGGAVFVRAVNCIIVLWLVGNRVAPPLDEEISAMRMKCFKRFFPDQDERRVVNIEYAKFSGCLDGFGDLDSMVDRGVLKLRVWWLVHGASAPILQSLALKLLSQPCSSSCCKRN